ncbi:hypothetical protein BWI93_04135 [Siphonobacter sp. BAB-5385]|uniref:RNA polymerase sigma factor n=1 Tax=Siphonobacter sp. BAB-5385 TaxID=1864822 RepID=UPI000B9DF161|nr:sigma-70 family RNA polymerase sigma factor [Siphonobacter sp. BAB-5385]OZI09356.1 hypothetical protein BWI93_04135 [Siphonobacter sp. BAB-5385]
MFSSEKPFDLLEQELWSQFRAGDAHAFSELMKRYSRILFRYGSRLSLDEDLIKDCIQDVFFDLWEHRSTISQPAVIKPYLYKALRLRIFREQAKWTRWENVEPETYFEFSVENHWVEQQHATETREQFEKLLNTLPKRQKEILYLKFSEELPHEDIAAIMNMNRQSVYNLLHEAIARLRKNWHDMPFYLSLGLLLLTVLFQ